MIAMIAALLVGFAQPAGEACEVTPETRAAMLALDYQKFDQTPAGGWRIWGEGRKCYAEATALIVDYILYAATPLEKVSHLSNLRWHAGQTAALGGDEKRGLTFFKATHQEPDKERPDFDWNSYVDATIAFLEKDRSALAAARERLAKQKPFDNGYIPNLNVVDGFLRCFDKPYAEAYSDACMSDGKTP